MSLFGQKRKTGATVTDDTTSENGNAKPLLSTLIYEAGSGKQYKNRFLIVYGILGALFVIAAIALTLLIIRPATSNPTPWSSWEPKNGSSENKAEQIAAYVTSRYRYSEPVSVIPKAKLEFAGVVPDQKLPVYAIGVRKAPATNEGMRVITDLGKLQVYDMCGLGKNCSFGDTQAASAQRSRLARRQALELSLLTLKHVSSIDSVLTFLPPSTEKEAPFILFVERSSVSEQLSNPLSQTLPLSDPPLPTQPNYLESGMIDKLTFPKLFAFETNIEPTFDVVVFLNPANPNAEPVVEQQ